MKKNLFRLNILICGILFMQITTNPCYAIENNADNITVYTYTITKEQSKSANDLNIFLAKYLNDLNSHNFQQAGNYFASNYISGDGFNKEQVIDLLKQTWNKSPDLKYSTIIKNLRLSNNRASVDFTQSITGSTKDKSGITKDKGYITGNSYNILYLEKFGCGWRIVSDKTIHEEITIKYGTAKNINIYFEVPEQVLSDEDYPSAIKVDLPPEIFALGSITTAPLVYPMKQSEETFRQIPSETNFLERVLKSNKNNQNEIASASISFCEALRSNYTGIDLKITGTAVIFKRVNILPKRD